MNGRKQKRYSMHDQEKVVSTLGLHVPLKTSVECIASPTGDRLASRFRVSLRSCTGSLSCCLGCRSIGDTGCGVGGRLICAVKDGSMKAVTLVSMREVASVCCLKISSTPVSWFGFSLLELRILNGYRRTLSVKP
ncbi:hypothetical protein Tco_0756948 [Tanacetum coccineum]